MYEQEKKNKSFTQVRDIMAPQQKRDFVRLVDGEREQEKDAGCVGKVRSLFPVS